MLCPTIVITFSSCAKINSFALSHHESYEVNLLPTTRLTSNSKTLKLAITFSSCTKINLFTLSHHESYEVNLLTTSYVGNNLRDNPNSDTTAKMILVVRAMHCLLFEIVCLFEYVTVRKTLRTTCFN